MKVSKERLRQIIQEELEAGLQEQQLLNEGLFSWFWDVLTGIPGGAVENIKEWIGGKVLNWVGIESGSVVHKIGMNFFGNLTLEDVTGMMSGDEKCENITRELAGSITEYFAEEIPPMMGFEMDGWLSGAFRESMGTSLLEPLNQGIAQGLCNLDFTSLFQGGGGGSVSEAQNLLLERFGDNASILEEEEKWIQGAEKDIERRGTEGVCTGDKFGSESCPPGSKRYNLAKTFRKMAKDKKKK